MVFDRQLNVSDADQLPPHRRTILLFIDPRNVDAIDTTAVVQLCKDKTLGIGVHIAHLPDAAS